MNIKLLSIENNINVFGFRRIVSQIKTLYSDADVCYVTKNSKSLSKMFSSQGKSEETFHNEMVHEISSYLENADIVGISTMTQYSFMAKEIFRSLKRKKNRPFLLWGGIHPTVYPNDAIEAVDAICVGEGELAIKDFLEAFEAGKDVTNTPNFWFNTNGEVKRNQSYPLLSSKEMNQLPHLYYGEPDEKIYLFNKDFQPLTTKDYKDYNALGYKTVWTLGCPYNCAYCSNSIFIALDKNYRKIRHPSVEYLIEEVAIARKKHSFISSVVFYDDNFIAMPIDTLNAFADQWKKEIGMPFFVMGVNPDLLTKKKLEILIDAGLNRVRMGVQNGSKNILDLYQRTAGPEKIKKSVDILSSLQDKMLPPYFDVIINNPMETKENLIESLNFFYDLPRPYILNLSSLQILPNTKLEKIFMENKVPYNSMLDDFFHFEYNMNTIVLMLLNLWHPPKWLFEYLTQKVEPYINKPKTYPLFGKLLQGIHLLKRAYQHIRFMNFSSNPGLDSGWGWFVWKGITKGIYFFSKRG